MMNEKSQIKDERVIFILLPRISQKGFFVSLLAIIIFKRFFCTFDNEVLIAQYTHPFSAWGGRKRKYILLNIFFSPKL